MKIYYVLFCTLTYLTFAQSSEKISDMFENDSQFMKGFETGIYLRTSGSDVQEYGCKMPEKSKNNSYARMIGRIKQ